MVPGDWFALPDLLDGGTLRLVVTSSAPYR